MNWEAIGAIGEILGAIAVLGTLIYLVAQLRQNTASVTTATYESMMSGITDINLVVVGDPDVASILARGARDPHSLDDDEALRYTTLVRHAPQHGVAALLQLLTGRRRRFFPQEQITVNSSQRRTRSRMMRGWQRDSS
jgi:hypothetical protein